MKNNNQHQYLSLRRFAALYQCEADWKRDGLHSVRIFEPLETDVPRNSRVYVSSYSIQFFDPKTKKEIISLKKGNDYHDILGLGDMLVLLDDGYWYHITGGRVEFVNNCWHFIWFGCRNERFAAMMNHGFPRYKNYRLVPILPEFRHLIKLICKRIGYYLRYRKY